MSVRESVYNILDSLPDEKMRDVLNMLVKYAGKTADPFYGDSNMSVLRQSIREAEAGKLTHHELIEA